MRYFHSSSINNRTSILEKGLLNNLAPNHISYGYNNCVFFDTSFENVNEFHEYTGEECDVWELINLKKYEFFKDKNWFGGVYTESHISKEDIILVKKSI